LRIGECGLRIADQKAKKNSKVTEPDLKAATQEVETMQNCGRLSGFLFNPQSAIAIPQ
jgi:hypothetical protein